MRSRVLGAGTLARVSSEGLPLAIVLAVAGRGGSAAFAGLLLALATLPQVATGPAGGALLDRTSRPGWVLGAAAALTGSAIAALAASGSAGPAAVVAALAIACTDPLLTGGLSATFTRWGDARGASTHTVSAWDGVAYNTAGVAGPLLVTVVAATAGSATALWVLAATLVPAAILVGFVPPVRGGDPHDGPRVRAALRAMWADRPLRAVTVTTTVEMAALGGLAIALVAAAASHGHTAQAAGIALTLRAVAALAGSLLLTRFGRAIGARALVLGSVVISGGGLVAMGWVPWWGVVALGAAVGLADGPVLVGTYRARVAGAPPQLRASVFTVGASLKLAASAAGSLVAGLALAERATTSGLIAIGAVSLAGAAAGHAVARRL